MKALRSLIFLVMLVLAACARPNYEDPQRDPAADELGLCDLAFTQVQICANLIWEKKPTESEMGSFVLEFYNPNDRAQFVEHPGQLEVLLWMPSMGHGSSPVVIEKLALGQYRVSRVFFIMRGDWEIQIKFTNGKSVLDQVHLPYQY